MDAIVIDNLTKSFGSNKALDSLSLRVEAGTVCGFIGPNGAGKTTAIRILLGLLDKDGGTVQALGSVIEFGRESAVRARMAYLPQDPVFPERHTGREVMRLVARLYGMDKRAAVERTDLLLNEFHLEKAADRGAATYSKGMKQRLGLAACFLPEPELLVLDEPVSALDPEGRVEVFEIVKKVKGKSTVLFSSHILDDVERVSDTLVMIKNGRKVLEGTIDGILSQYGTDRLKVRFRPADSERGRRIVEGLAWVEGVTEGDQPGEMFAVLKPDTMDSALDNTLPALVRDGVRVIEYGRARLDLESLFLRLSAD